MTNSRKYSLAHLTVPGMHPFEMVEVAARTGFTHVGFRFTQVTPNGWASPMHEDAHLMRATKQRLSDADIGVLDVEVARLLPDTRRSELEILLAGAAEIGAEHILGQIHDDDRERGLDNFALLCDIAGDLGLTVNLEFLPWTQNRSLATAATYVGIVNRSNVGVMIDSLHFDRSSSSVEDLRVMPDRWFRYVQLCDAPAAQPATIDEMIHTAREARLDPGVGGLDLKRLLQALPRDVAISLEVPNTERERSVPIDTRLMTMLARAKTLLEVVEAEAA